MTRGTMHHRIRLGPLGMTERDTTQHREQFAELRAMIGAELRRVVADALALLPRDLEAAGSRAPHPRERHSLYAAASLLRLDETERSGRVAAAFDDRVRRCLALAEIDNPDERSLALIDEDELDAQIVTVELAGAVRAAAGPDYVDYAQRVQTLCPRAWQDDDFNPLGARAIASAAVAAFHGAAESAAAKSALRSLLPQHLTGRIVGILAAARARMIEMGVAPMPTEAPIITDRRADVSSVADAVPAPAPPESVAPRAAPSAPWNPAAIAAESAATADALGSSPLSAVGEEKWRGVLPMLRPIFEIERDAIAFAHSIDVSPYGRDARSAYFGGVRAGLREAGAGPAQIAVVDVVAGLFDYVVDDRRLSEAAKPLLWRLQQPAVSLALMDAGYLGEEPRSLRRLIENLGAIASVHGDELSPENALYRRLETAVRAVEIVTSALQTRATVIAHQVDKEYSRAARNIEQLIERVIRERKTLETAPGGRNRRDYSRRPGPEREVQVTQQVEEMLAQRLDEKAVPETTREFLTNVWARHLRTAALRGGEQGPEFQLALNVVDELLWSLGGTQQRVSRSQLARKIPSLIRTLTRGTRDIGARDEDYKAFFDELFLIHLRRMHRGAGSGRSGATTLPSGTGHAEEAGAARSGSPSTRASTRRGQGEASTTSRAAPPAATPHPAPAPPVDPFAVRGDPGYGRRATDAPPAGAMLFDVLPPLPTLQQRPPEAARTVPAPLPERAAQEKEVRESEPDGVPTEPASDATRSESEGNQRLLDILKSLDLDDLPSDPRQASLEPEQAFRRIHRGGWLEFSEPGAPPAYLKVAWVNRRRTVALLVRRSDRRAVSIRFSELQKRFARGRVHLIEPEAR